MPGGKRTTRKRGIVHRWVRRTGRVMSMASKALATAYAVKKLVNVEYKVNDVNDTTNITTTVNVFRLSGIAQGDDMTNREGRSIKCNSLMIRHRSALDTSGTAGTQRVIIGIDWNSQTALPASSDVIVADTPTAQRTILTSKNRFKILMDKTYTLNINGNREMCYQKYFKLGHHIAFDGTTNTSDAKGKIFCILLGTTSANPVTSTFQSRLSFIDN